MAKRKLKRVEIIILVGFISSGLTLLGFWWNNKQTNRDFYLPAGYDGWIMISYGVEGAPPLPMVDGIQQIQVPDSGILLTSSPLEIGWRRDRYFWVEADGTQREVPQITQQEAGPAIHLHQHQYLSRNYMEIGKLLEPGQDTTLADETEITRTNTGMLNYKPGLKSLEYFYLSAEAQPLQFNPPPNPRSEGLETLETREIKLD